MRPTQLLARLPHSHIDPNWPPTVERESRTNFEFYKGQQTTFQRKRIGNGKSASQLRSQQATQVDGERHLADVPLQIPSGSSVIWKLGISVAPLPAPQHRFPDTQGRLLPMS